MDINSALLKQIILNVPNYIFWKDENLIYRGCNYNFAKSAGFDSPNGVIGKSDDEMLWGTFGAKTYQAEDAEVIKTGNKIINKEVSILLPGDENKIRVLSISKVPLYNDNGEINGILGIYIDITTYKELQTHLIKEKDAAESANKAKTEFLENMRHDIRTPLSGIVGFASLLKNELENTKLQEYADNLIASSHALLDLMNEVLEATKISSGEIPIVIKKFDLRKKLQDVVLLNQAKAKLKDLQLTMEFDPFIPQYVIGDPIRTHRIVLELVANALNFTDKGQVSLTVQMAKRDHRSIVIKICVIDTGIGIPADKQQDIFVQFKRLSPSYRGIYHGRGLGLAIIKQFIDELQGELYVKSELGIGTEFTCLIPLREALTEDEFGCDYEPCSVIKNNKQIESAAESKDKTCSTFGKSKILLIEDDTLTTMVERSVLTNLDCEVDTASDGRTALEHLGNNQYDLIFLDIGLPDIAGCELTKCIRLLEQVNGTRTPIIAITAHIDSENRQRCIEAGINAIMNKPLTPKNAYDILEAFVVERVE
jgi:two-component system aerobic respiration control sensor histidine kinase ArcB